MASIARRRRQDLGAPRTEKTRHIGKVRVDPHDPDTAYVAALGTRMDRTRSAACTARGWRTDLEARAVSQRETPARSTSRSIRTTRGSSTPRSGGDPPPVGARLRRSGLRRLPQQRRWRTWKEITRSRGLPKGTLGKVGISASAAKSGRVYAIIEAEDGGVYRSDDFGESWTRGSEDRNLRSGAWYYDHIYGRPKDPETVVGPQRRLVALERRREDLRADLSMPHGDNHDLWIDPTTRTG